MDFTKIKNIYTSKGTLDKMRIKPKYKENNIYDIFIKYIHMYVHIYNKLVSKIYK